MPRFKTIAFYTEGTPYKQEAQGLIKNAKKFGIDVEIMSYPSRGEWVKNAAMKSIFISAMMDKYSSEEVEYFLYLDADARFHSYPELFDTFEGDIGVHYRRGKELLSGTIFLRNCSEVHALIREWIKQQDRNPRTWDQKVLQGVLKNFKDLKVVDLPPSYTQIFDSMAHHGTPIIQHMQASRRFRNVVTTPDSRPDPIPDSIDGVRIRRGYDGTYYLARRNQRAEKYLDERCTRLDNQLRWLPQTHTEEDIRTLQPYFFNVECCIVGKGPSLDYLTTEYFPNPRAPIIALNEAIHTVEKLDLPNPTFCLQQDAKLKDVCYPKHSRIFVSVKAANWYVERERVYVFDSRRYGLNLNSLSVSAAIRIAQSLGATRFILLCFDACVNGKLHYAKAITNISHDVVWGGEPIRFLSHRPKIEKCLASSPAVWIIPEESAV